jgi:hypothetical protein
VGLTALSQVRSVGWGLAVGGVVAGLAFGAVYFSWSRIAASTSSRMIRTTVLIAKCAAILMIPTVVVGVVLAI